MIVSTNYIVIQSGDPELLCRLVESQVMAGYEPLGGIAVTTRDGSVGFFQALIKRAYVE